MHHWYEYLGVGVYVGAFHYLLGIATAMLIRLECDWFEDLTEDARGVAWFGVATFWPVFALWGLWRGVVHGVPALAGVILGFGRGVRDIYRVFVPAKTKVPEARVVERR